MVRFPICVLAFATLVIIGCTGSSADSKIPASARAALDRSDQFELLSIDPVRQEERPKADFHGWKVLGRTEIKDAAIRKKLVAALKRGAAENDGTFAACFNPRHGIRTTHGSKTIDFVICFECLQVQVYADEKRDSGFLTMDSPQPVFDQVLREAGVQLAQSAKK